MSKPKVSIIVPAFNVEPYFAACLDSLCLQYFTDIEVIVIDDGLDDGTAGIACSYAALDNRICVFSQCHKGVSAARNFGLSVSSGDYIAFVDSDDWVLPEAFGLLYAKSVAFDADIVLGSLLYCYENGVRNKVGDASALFPEQIVLDGKSCFCNLQQMGIYVPMLCSSFFKASFLKKYCLGFECTFHEDEFFTPQAMFYAERIINFKDDFYFYRQRPHSIMHSDNGMLRAESLIHICNTFISFTEKNISDETLNFCYYLLRYTLSLYKRTVSLYKQLGGTLSRDDVKPVDFYKLHKLTPQFNACLSDYLYSIYFSVLEDMRLLLYRR